MQLSDSTWSICMSMPLQASIGASTMLILRIEVLVDWTELVQTRLSSASAQKVSKGTGLICVLRIKAASPAI